MNTVKEGSSVAVTMLGAVLFFNWAPPDPEVGPDDTVEQEVSQAQPVHRERPRWWQSLVPSPAFKFALRGGFA